MKRIWTVAVLAAIFATGAIADTTSEAFSFYTFRERTDRVTILVDSYPAALHDDERYLPLSVAVGVESPGSSLTFSAESFTLVDPTGKSLPSAAYEDLAREYRRREFDAALLRQRPISTGEQFTTSLRVDARFYPSSTEGTRTDRVELAPFTWFRTLIYFPRPASGLDGVFTLRVRAAGMDAPLDVRFRVPRLDERR